MSEQTTHTAANDEPLAVPPPVEDDASAREALRGVIEPDAPLPLMLT